MNQSLTDGAIPSNWKLASVTPIQKTGSITDAAKYRPISTLPVFAKILECAVHIISKTTGFRLSISPVIDHSIPKAPAS